MGWFWADSTPTPPAGHPSVSQDGPMTPPPSCPMHKHQRGADAMAAPAKSTPSPESGASACPVPHASRAPAPPSEAESQSSTLSKLNPLNYMFPDLSQKPAPNQSQALPTEREPSTIPRGDGSGNWEYPSPQQMYNALLRKGYTDTDVTAVESMVSVHNFLNEGAWEEIMDWERRFSGGLYRGWQLCKQGENNFGAMVKRYGHQKAMEDLSPSLVRFQGRPQEMTPKAAMIQVMGWLYPGAFGTEPPFDRHDWYVTREGPDGKQKEMRYIIDYYSGPEDEKTGEPVFYLDVRPAMTPTTAIERSMRWGCDVWWRASGGDVREAEKKGN